MAHDNLYLFGPKNEKDLKRQYPELGKEPEFQKLTVGELLFVWWYSNATSPLCADDNLSDKERAMKAYGEAFKKSDDEEKKMNYYSCVFPSNVKTAIDRMRRYNPNVRARAKVMLEKILKNYEGLIDVDLEDFVEVVKDENDEIIGKKINWPGRNSYVNSAKVISEALPNLIRQVEDGFGVFDSKDAAETGLKAIQRFHETHTDK